MDHRLPGGLRPIRLQGVAVCNPEPDDMEKQVRRHIVNHDQLMKITKSQVTSILH